MLPAVSGMNDGWVRAIANQSDGHLKANRFRVLHALLATEFRHIGNIRCLRLSLTLESQPLLGVRCFSGNGRISPPTRPVVQFRSFDEYHRTDRNNWNLDDMDMALPQATACQVGETVEQTPVCAAAFRPGQTTLTSSPGPDHTYFIAGPDHTYFITRRPKGSGWKCRNRFL